MNTTLRSPWFWLAAAALALLGLFIVYPVANVLTASVFSGGGESGWIRFFATPKYREAVKVGFHLLEFRLSLFHLAKNV